MKDRGLGVKLALDDKGQVGGMIQYVPIELSPSAKGKVTVTAILLLTRKSG